MTIHSVTEMWSRRASRDTSPDGREYTASYRGAYQVEHTADSTEDEIRNADGVPALRSIYPGQEYVYCTNRQVDKVGPIFSIVNVEWVGETGADVDVTALDQATQWKFESIATIEETDIDGFGQPLTNVNGEPVAGLTKDLWDWRLTVSKNFDTFNTYALNTYANSTNSDNYGPPGNSWPPGTGHLEGVSVEPTDTSGAGYIKGSMTVLFRTPYNTTAERAWWHRYLNQGVYERLGTFIIFSAPNAGQNKAAGYAVVNSSNIITDIVVTNPGSGYFSPPSVTISSSFGSDAAATAFTNAGRVVGVRVDDGGTDYKSKIVRAVDDQDNPITQPLLLGASGERLDNSDNAIYLERPRYSFSLPFSALGFNF